MDFNMLAAGIMIGFAALGELWGTAFCSASISKGLHVNRKPAAPSSGKR